MMLPWTGDSRVFKADAKFVQDSLQCPALMAEGFALLTTMCIGGDQDARA